MAADKVAEVDANLKQLSRDYRMVQDRYQDLLQQREELQSRERLDPVTDGVQLSKLPLFAAIEPVGPNRPVVVMFAFEGTVAVLLRLALGEPGV